jgi:hypothetical protein
MTTHLSGIGGGERFETHAVTGIGAFAILLAVALILGLGVWAYYTVPTEDTAMPTQPNILQPAPEQPLPLASNGM